MDHIHPETMQVLLAVAILIVAFGISRYLGQYLR